MCVTHNRLNFYPYFLIFLNFCLLRCLWAHVPGFVQDHKWVIFHEYCFVIHQRKMGIYNPRCCISSVMYRINFQCLFRGMAENSNPAKLTLWRVLKRNANDKSGFGFENPFYIHWNQMASVIMAYFQEWLVWWMCVIHNRLKVYPCFSYLGLFFFFFSHRYL